MKRIYNMNCIDVLRQKSVEKSKWRQEKKNTGQEIKSSREIHKGN